MSLSKSLPFLKNNKAGTAVIFNSRAIVQSSPISISFNFIKPSFLNFSKNEESNLQDLHHLEHKTTINRSSSRS